MVHSKTYFARMHRPIMGSPKSDRRKDGDEYLTLTPDERLILKIHRKHDRFIVPRVLPRFILEREVGDELPESSGSSLNLRILRAQTGLLEKGRIVPDTPWEEELYIPTGVALPEGSSLISRQVMHVLSHPRQPQEVGLTRSAIVAGWKIERRREKPLDFSKLRAAELGVDSALEWLVGNGILSRVPEIEVSKQRLYKYRFVQMGKHARSVWSVFGSDSEAIGLKLSYTDIQRRIAESGEYKPRHAKRVTELGTKQLTRVGAIYKEEDGRYRRYTNQELVHGYKNLPIRGLARTAKELLELVEFWEAFNPPPQLGRNVAGERAVKYRDPQVQKLLVDYLVRRADALLKLEVLSDYFDQVKDVTLRRILGLDSLWDFDEASPEEWILAIANVQTMGGLIGGPIRFEGSQWISDKIDSVYETVTKLGLGVTSSLTPKRPKIRSPEGLNQWGTKWPGTGGRLASHTRMLWPTFRILPRHKRH